MAEGQLHSAIQVYQQQLTECIETEARRMALRDFLMADGVIADAPGVGMKTTEWTWGKLESAVRRHLDKLKIQAYDDSRA